MIDVRSTIPCTLEQRRMIENTKPIGQSPHHCLRRPMHVLEADGARACLHPEMRSIAVESLLDRAKRSPEIPGREIRAITGGHTSL